MKPRITMIEVQYAKGRNAFKGFFDIQDFEGEEQDQINAMLDDALNARFVNWDANPEEFFLGELTENFTYLGFDEVVELEFIGNRVYREKMNLYRNHENRYFVSFDEYQEKLT